MSLDKISSELRLVGLLVLVTLALGIAAIYAFPLVTAQDRSGDTVDSYSVTLHSDGTLDETYVYRIVSTDTRFLFRFWDEAVVPSGSGYPSDQTHLELITITAPPGTTAYLKDDLGRVTIYSGDDSQTIRNLAYWDEVGAFNPLYYSPGSYTVSYKYRLYFPVDSDGSFDHLNIQFAREHITYGNVKIVLEDAGAATTVYTHPPSLQVSRSGDDVTITGASPENELLEVEMLASTASSPWRSWGIVYPETNTKALTDAANQQYTTQYWTAYSVNLLGKAAVLLVPFLLLGLWFRFGREEDVTVPHYLSTVPNPDRRPWYVNLVYNKGMLKFDENGFYATLLDLDNRGKIKILPWEEEHTSQTSNGTVADASSRSGGGLRILILDTAVSDEYERKVMGFFVNNSTPNATNPTQPVFDTDTLNTLANQITSAGEPSVKALTAQTELAALMSPLESGAFGAWRKIPKEQMTDNSRYLYVLPTVGLLFLGASLGASMWASIVAYMLTLPVVMGMVILAQFMVASLFPVHLLGRYKPGLYREKLEWNAFREFLGDFSQMQKYGTEDLAMWGSWLVYGTALGVGDKVAQAMKSLNVRFPAAQVPVIAHRHFYPIITASRPVTYSGGRSHGGFHGGGGGGGHGGGGGRGGGGAGRR
jgi:uncharacterized membrane protein